MQFVYQHPLIKKQMIAWQSKLKRFQMAWEKHFLMPDSVYSCILFQADLDGDDDDDDGSMCGVCAATIQKSLQTETNG